MEIKDTLLAATLLTQEGVKMNLPKDHFSVSQLNTFQRCPVQYYFAYIKGLKRPLRKGGRLIQGRAGHKALENNFEYKKVQSEDLGVNQLLDVFSTEFDKNANEAQQIGIEWERPQGEIKDEGVELLKVYHKTECPQITPLLISERFMIELLNEYPPLVGEIDLVTDQQIIVDWKLTSMKRNPEMLVYDTQLRCYKLGYKSITGQDPVGCEYHDLRRLKKPVIEKTRLPQLSEADDLWFLRTLGRVIQNIKTGIFYPIPSVMNCSWCGYYKDCANAVNW